MEYQLIESLLSPIEQLSATVIERVLTNRGIKLTDIPHYLNTTDKDILNPNLLTNMHIGAQMLIQHIAAGDKIMLIVDADADGYTSSAILLNYLNRLFPGFTQNNIDYFLHEGKAHGIQPDMLKRCLERGYKMLIVPDGGTNDYDQHSTLYNEGIDVLVIDHHEADYVSPHACIINNQMCSYPNKTLSGAGMVYKFCSFIDQMCGYNLADDLLDLTAVGIVADVMDLRDFETKHIVSKGVNSIKNPFLKQYCATQSYSIERGGGVNPFTIGWYIGPAINATIRMGSIEENYILFESMLEFKAYDSIPSTKKGYKGKYELRVEQACRNCVNIKNHQTKARDTGLALMEAKIQKENLDKNKIILLQTDENEINPNIAGLIAMKLMTAYKKPILVLKKKPDYETGEILLEGSARNTPVEGMEDFKQFLNDSGYMYLAAGHANAFGAGLLASNVEPLIEYANEKLKDCRMEKSYKVDFIWQANDFTAHDVLEIAELNNIYGQGVEQPLIALKNVKISQENFQICGKGTIKISLPNGVEIVHFYSSAEMCEDFARRVENKDFYIDIIGTCSINEYYGKVMGQIKIEDYEIKEDVDWFSYF